MGTLKDMRGALALLSIVPVGSLAPEDAPSPAAAAWFPWVGVLLGGVVLVPLLVLHAASVLYGDAHLLERASLPLAFLVVGGWAYLSRFLHWDGLADVADGLWGGHTPERRLEIMADSHIGAFGAAAVAIVAIGTYGSISLLLARIGMGMALFAAPVFGRLAATFACWLGSPARPGGLGARVVGRPHASGVIIAVMAVAVAAVSMTIEHGLAGTAWSAASVVIAAGVPHALARPVGGVTGDIMGASVVITEAVVLAAAAVMAAW